MLTNLWVVLRLFLYIIMQFFQNHVYGIIENQRNRGQRSSNNINKATPIKCLDLVDTNCQLQLEGWFYIVLIFYTLFYEEAPFYWEFQIGGPNLLAIWERTEEAPFNWVNLVGGWWIFLFMSKTVLEVGWSFILWPPIDLEGWSSRSSYFIGVAL